MKEDACGVSEAFSCPHQGGSEGYRKGLGGGNFNKVKGSGGRFGRVAACASSGLFFVTSEDLKARAGEVGGKAVKPAWPPCWPSSMMESRTLAIKSEIEE